MIKKLMKTGMCACLAMAMTDIAQAQEKKELPVRIYVMVGQSNMQGHGHVEGEQANTLQHIVKNDSKKEFQFLIEADGKWRERSDVWIHLKAGPGSVTFGGLKPGYGANKGAMGPELGFGHKMGDSYDGQVLIIKAAWGGKSLGNDFLPPSIGKYPKPGKPGDAGFYYQEMIGIVKDVTENMKTYFPAYQGQGIEFAGVCFHQGWNDMGDTKYEQNLETFINDIRSAEYGLGVPDLPFVIATGCGIMGPTSTTVMGQLAMADKAKYPKFEGNVAVIDTTKPYGPENLQFKFEANESPRNQAFHWHGNARTHLNLGFSMAAEMQKLKRPVLPSRLVGYGAAEGVQLTWQYGSEKPKSLKLSRNGKSLPAELSPSKTVFVDATALPGKNSYELALEMPTSSKQTLSTTSDSSVTDLKGFRAVEGVGQTWQARGKYEGFKLSRNGTVIEAALSGEARSFEDKQAPKQGIFSYSVQPTTGDVTPAKVTVNLGPIAAGAALVYEPFDYPSDPKNPLSILGKSGAVGTKGAYYSLNKAKPEPASVLAVARGLEFGSLPVMGNCVTVMNQTQGYAIELDGSLEKAWLLKDGATLWFSYVFYAHENHGCGSVSLQSEDLKEGVGYGPGHGEFQTVVIKDGKAVGRRIGPLPMMQSTLVVGKLVWGKDGGADSFTPYVPGHDLKQPEKPGRGQLPFNIDQSKLNRLVIQGKNGHLDEIRLGPTYESVVGGGKK